VPKGAEKKRPILNLNRKSGSTSHGGKCKAHAPCATNHQGEPQIIIDDCTENLQSLSPGGREENREASGKREPARLGDWGGGGETTPIFSSTPARLLLLKKFQGLSAGNQKRSGPRTLSHQGKKPNRKLKRSDLDCLKDNAPPDQAQAGKRKRRAILCSRTPSFYRTLLTTWRLCLGQARECGGEEVRRQSAELEIRGSMSGSPSSSRDIIKRRKAGAIKKKISPLQ